MPEPHFVLEWSRNIVNGEPNENVKGYLPVSEEEKLSSWGPGRFPWQLVFQYDPDWAQWKMSFLPQGSAPAKTDSRNESGTFATTSKRASDQSASRSSPDGPSKPRKSTTNCDSEKNAGPGQQINLFWDHWRLRKMPLQGSSTTAVVVEKEAARGGRNYGDAQSTDTSQMHPSHLLISLP